MPRVTKYRGKDENELQGMSSDSFIGLLTSRARRAVIRSSAKSAKVKNLMRKALKVKRTDATKVIRTHLREAVIIPEWLGLTFGVYNGKEFKSVMVTIEKIGYRLGDFSHTTGRVLHSGPGVGATRGSKFIPLK